MASFLSVLSQKRRQFAFTWDATSALHLCPSMKRIVFDASNDVLLQMNQLSLARALLFRGCCSELKWCKRLFCFHVHFTSFSFSRFFSRCSTKQKPCRKGLLPTQATGVFLGVFDVCCVGDRFSSNPHVGQGAFAGGFASAETIFFPGPATRTVSFEKGAVAEDPLGKMPPKFAHSEIKIVKAWHFRCISWYFWNSQL